MVVFCIGLFLLCRSHRHSGENRNQKRGYRFGYGNPHGRHPCHCMEHRFIQRCVLGTILLVEAQPHFHLFIRRRNWTFVDFLLPGFATWKGIASRTHRQIKFGFYHPPFGICPRWDLVLENGRGWRSHSCRKPRSHLIKYSVPVDRGLRFFWAAFAIIPQAEAGNAKQLPELFKGGTKDFKIGVVLEKAFTWTRSSN